MNVYVLVVFIVGLLIGGIVGVSALAIVAIAWAHEGSRKERKRDKN